MVDLVLLNWKTQQMYLIFKKYFGDFIVVFLFFTIFVSIHDKVSL